MYMNAFKRATREERSSKPDWGDVASVVGNGDLVGSTRGCAIDRHAKAVSTSRHRWGLMRALSEARLPGEM